MTLSLAAPAQAIDKYDYYVALGDSYAAGVGAGAYVDSTCGRSANAYSELADDLKSVKVTTNVACGGATTEIVVNSQLGVLDWKTDLVTITAGGNNLDFGTLAAACATALVGYPASPECTAAATNAIIEGENGQLAGEVGNMILSVHAAAPNARIVVTGYPYILEPLPASQTDPTSFNAVATRLINGLNGSIELAATTAAGTFGVDVTFVGVTEAFAGHGALTQDPWINLDFTDPGSFLHPNAAGYRDGYLAALTAAGAYTP
ncbi:SGNH/GDSL hydrolase family protein [Arthrobacter sp. HMWF013]|uniref:SGNH/GDSL hydrolase family protein n=1 Tax=Arthrobacter sp. HMWF013 TaxID=2056849 RepID=UPI0015E7E98C|nr:SGNH/GDSL hydrolase family protein [Arthrobacter sp. HMWF013]